ncbi:histidine phosphatase family protein [Roseivivax jejudonensis]
MRHGPTAWNRARFVMWRADVPLDTCAVAEAAVAAGNFEYSEIDALFSSP